MLESVIISKEMQLAMQGVVPAVLGTCAADGTPNVTYISQVYYIDNNQVALSCQFMNKTARNLQENPLATVIITCPNTASMWKLNLRYLESQTKGPLFELMEMQLQAIITMLSIPVNFSLQAAAICNVETIEQIYNGRSGT